MTNMVGFVCKYLTTAEESTSAPSTKKKKKKKEFNPNLAIADADHKVRHIYLLLRL